MSIGRAAVGHPVDVASGTVYATHQDCAISGHVPLIWERYYSTSLLDESPGVFGAGWSTRYAASLERTRGAYRFKMGNGGVEVFEDAEGQVERGGFVRNLGTFQEINKVANRYIVTQWEAETGEVERYIFNQGREGQPWLLASIEDVTGQGLDLLRDDRGRLIGIRQRREQRTLKLSYTADQRIHQLSLAVPGFSEQILVRYEYDAQGRLSAAHDALGYADRFEYDREGRMTREVRRDGGVFSFRYDDRGRCIWTTGLDGYDAKSLRFLDHLGVTEVSDTRGYKWLFYRLPTGQVERVVSPLGEEALTVYDEHDRIAEEVAPGGASTAYRYDEHGNLAELTNPLGDSVQYSYNQQRQTTQIIDVNGNAWRREYDERGYLVALINPLGNWWHYRYDDQGDLVERQNPLGSVMRLRYNTRGEEIERTDWKGRIEDQRTYNARGKVVKWVNGAGHEMGMDYDALGQLRTIRWHDGSTVSYTYDAGGNVTQEVDAEGKRTRYRYGPCGLLQEKENALGGTVRFAWGTEPGQLMKVENERGETHTFDYDAEGRLIKEVGFDGQTKTFRYNEGGFCSAQTNAWGEETLFERDARGQLRRKILPDGTEASFDYDPLGHMVRAVNATCELQFEYDAMGQLVRETQADEWIESEFNAWGDKIAVKTSQGLDVTFDYDPNGQLKTILPGEAPPLRFLYDDRGLERQRSLGHGIEIFSQHDKAGHLVARSVDKTRSAVGAHRPSEAQTHYQFLFNHVDDLLEKRVDEQTTVYQYDALGQFLGHRSSNGKAGSFSYDAAGNISTADGVSRHYDVGNRLLEHGDTAYEYNQEGQLIRKTIRTAQDEQVWTYQYHGTGELGQVVTPQGKTVSYSYDALGRRVEKRSEGQATRFIWHGDVLIHEVQDHAPRTDYIFKPGTFEPLVQITDDTPYYFVTDHISTPQELLTVDGNVAWTGDIAAWGQTEYQSTSRVEMRLRFQGQYYDSETGLHYNRFRYYDPEIGRFTTPDPISLMGGLNLYRYAPNPTWWVDPFGLNISQNAADGAQREADREVELQGRYPQDSVQREQYLRDANGKILRDPVTGEARRVDMVVISQDGRRIRRLEEVTSMTAPKSAQQAKEARIRAAGGIFVRDRRTRKLVRIGSRQRIHCTRKA